ncbi:MAG: dihydrodipicolinate synthase family protein [Acidobacteria bacterium]|nr:dihydrodipicolinate synthase family protein [Acidobacteriota bacterium]MBS1865275.1 dihydrodipicolinate synthase family protein [Acidobacteriota bacterium]
MDLSGIFAALTTPFDFAGSFSSADLKHNLHRYNQTDLAGYVVLGSTGESVLLSAKEMDAIFSTAIESAAPDKRLLAGTGAESTAETISRTKRAAELGYRAALVKTPYYYKPVYKPEVYLTHYRAVADASPIPILLYSVPQFTGVTLETPEILALAEHPNIIGMKDSSGVIQRIVEVVAGTPPTFQMLTGAASVIMPALSAGAVGGILALASAFPEKCVAIHQLYRQKMYDQARELQGKLSLASKKVVSECGIAGVKFVMDLRGYKGGVPRLPILPLSDSTKAAITKIAANLEPSAARA